MLVFHKGQELRLDYFKQADGSRSIRHVIFEKIFYGTTAWHPEPQFLMTAFDVERKGWRDFPLSGIMQISCATATELRTVFKCPDYRIDMVFNSKSDKPHA